MLDDLAQMPSASDVIRTLINAKPIETAVLTVVGPLLGTHAAQMPARAIQEKEMKKFYLALFALASTFAITVMLGGVPARADGLTTASGGAGAGAAGDWSQEFEESGVGSFDTVLLFSTAGDGLATPGLTDADSAGWTETDLDPGYASELTGAAVTQLYFDTNFVDPGTDDVFDLFALLDGTVVDSATFDNFGVGTSIGYGLYEEDSTPSLAADMSGVTPEPSSLLLLCTGLLGLAFVIFRKAKASGLNLGL